MDSYNKLDISKACSDGYVLCVYRTGVEFGIWKSRNFSWDNKHKEEDLLELHIFDERSEYRAIRSDAGNENGYITAVITDSNMSSERINGRMLLFGESFEGNDEISYTAEDSGRKKRIYLPYGKKEFEDGIYLKVCDYYDFDKNALLYHSGYRLTGIEIGSEKNE